MKTDCDEPSSEQLGFWDRFKVKEKEETEKPKSKGLFDLDMWDFVKYIGYGIIIYWAFKLFFN